MRHAHRCTVLLLSIAAALTANAQRSTQDTTLHAQPITHNNTPLIQPRTMAAHTPFDKQDPILPTITTNPVDGLGYDIVYTFNNDSNQPKSLGQIVVGTITLGESVSYLDLNHGSQLKHVTWDKYVAQAWRYPHTAYSPATALMNDEHAVGVSLLYPVLEYKHDVLITVNKAGGVFKGPKESRGWYVAFNLSNSPGAKAHTTLSNPAILQPGQTRSYTVAVRAIKRSPPRRNQSPTGPQDWLETLVPYRDHFQNLFGQVPYVRDNRAVQGKAAGYVGITSDRNPRGFFGDNTSRPDIAGFGPLASRLSEPNGFKRVMLWAPSGLYRHNRKHNFPPQFTQGWQDLPMLRTTSHRLRDVSRTGKQLGLWWGRSTQYAETWDPETLEPLSLANPAHLRSVATQIHLAAEAGAEVIGLDAFSHAYLPVWDQLRLIRAINSVYPELKLVAEPMCCDIIHAATPAFVTADRAPKNAKTELDFHRLKTPNYLADFLLPGHETWALFRYSEIRRVRNTDINAARMQRDAERLARLGFVPVMLADFPLGSPRRAQADQTWLSTVPAHLQPKPDSATNDPGATTTDGPAPPR